MVSTSRVWMKSRGTAGKPGGNRENKPHPTATTRTERGEIASERHAEVSRGHIRHDAGDASEAPQGRKAGQQIGGAVTRTGRRPERCPARGLKERRSRFVSSEGKASVRQLELPLDDPGDEAVTGTRREDAPVEETDLLERVLEPQNLRRALQQVRRNQGAPGIDGMTVDDLEEHVKTHWPTIRAALVEGTYAPQPVRRTVIPKAGGGTRNLGIPTVLDRCIEQALLQVLQEEWDPTFSERSPAFARSVVSIRRWHKRRQTSGQATRGWWTWTWRSAAIMHLDASFKHPEFFTRDLRGDCHASRGAAASTRHVPLAFVAQLPQQCDRLRAVGEQRQPRCGITSADDHTTLHEMVHPLRRHRQRACQLGHRQHPGPAPGMRLMTLVQQTVFEANGVDGTRQDLGTLRRSISLRGELHRTRLIGRPSRNQGQTLLLHGRCGAQRGEGPPVTGTSTVGVAPPCQTMRVCTASRRRRWTTT